MYTLQSQDQPSSSTFKHPLPVNLALSPVRLWGKGTPEGDCHEKNPDTAPDTAEYPEHSREWYAATALSRLYHVCKSHTASREDLSKSFIRELETLECRYLEVQSLTRRTFRLLKTSTLSSYPCVCRLSHFLLVLRNTCRLQELAFDKMATMKSLIERSKQYSRDVQQFLRKFVEDTLAQDKTFGSSLQSVAHTTFLSGMDALQASREDWHRDKVQRHSSLLGTAMCQSFA